MRRRPPQQLQLDMEQPERRHGPKRERRAEPGASGHRAATELLETPRALLTRSHLRELGLERRAVDAVFRALPVVALPGYSRPMIRVEDYLELLTHHTFRDDRVRPNSRGMMGRT